MSNIEEVIKTVTGCTELLQFAVNHLNEDPPDPKEAATLLVMVVKALADASDGLVLESIMSGNAAADMLLEIQDGLDQAPEAPNFPTMKNANETTQVALASPNEAIISIEPLDD